MSVPQSSSWPIIESHAREYPLVHEQIASCDDFMENGIQSILNNIDPVVVKDKHKKCVRTIKYGSCMTKPMSLPGFTDAEKGIDVTPQMCRLRDLSYVCVVSANVHQHIKYDNWEKPDEHLVEKVDIGDIPIMVKSKNCILSGLDKDELIDKGECPNDPGGYFILTGKERAIVAQERLSYNQLFVFPDKNGLKAEIRCHCEDTDQQSTIHLKYADKKQGPGIKVVIPHIHETKGVFLFSVFKVLGVESNEDIIKMILYPNMEDIEMKEKLEGSIAECEQIQTREQAIAYLAQYVKPRITNTQGQNIQTQSFGGDQRRTWLIHIIDRELFPHLHPQKQGSYDNINDNVFTSEYQEYLRTTEYRKRCIEKAWFLAYSVNRLIRVALERDYPSDRDHMAHKRLNLAGPLLRQLFKKKMQTQHNSMVKLLLKHINQNKDVKISGVMKQVDVTKGLAFSLKTGNWSGTKTNPTNSSKNQGVSQVLNRMNFTAPISHMRRTSASDTNLSVVRMLHNSQFGMCCPSETPEGHSCGLVKNLSMLCHITTRSETHLVYEWLKQNVNYIDVTQLSVAEGQGIVYGWKIFVNGKWIGISPETDTSEQSFDKQGQPNPIPEWVHQFREARSREENINSQVSISTYSNDRKEIYIFTDEGRFCRPLFVVDRKTKKLALTPAIVKKVKHYINPSSPPGDGWSWRDLIENHIIEYIDVAESESPKIATFFSDVNQTHTHCEIHPAMMLGLLASLISFPDHSQAPRNTYQSAMGKQALGIPTLNFNERYDTTNYVLYYPQKPLVCTKMHEIIGTNEMPSTQTTVVAVIEHTGYNQEDSIILNQGWIDRGGGRSTLYKTYKAETKKHKILPDDKFEKPNPEETMGMKKGNYDKLGDDGIVNVGTRVNKGDIIMGITGPSPTFSSFSRTRSYNKANTQRVATNINPKLTKKDRSVSIRLDGTVDSVMVTENSEQITMAKVRIRTIRTPKIGDKFAASSGQKGTVGMILPMEDMPYTERDGMVPDIIMNPHAFPSRMTINQQIGMLMGKLCALELKQGDSTPFQDKNDDDENIVDKISKQLKTHGFQSKGEEIFIDGTTGKKIKARIFVGPMDYQRLKHMVDDKKHSRSKGPHNQLTRQPVEGRMRDGGLRVGEMERDTLIAHGVAMNLLELMMKKSDEFTIHMCELCGLPAVAKNDRGIYYCTACDNMDHVYAVKSPYAFKLLFQELMGMLIVPRAELGSVLDQ